MSTQASPFPDVSAPPPADQKPRASRGLPAPLLAVLPIVVGMDAWIAGIAVHTGVTGAGRGTSIFGELFPVWHTATWGALPYAVFIPAVLAALLAALRPGARPAAAGVLWGLALEGYALALPTLAVRLNVGGPGIAGFALLLVGATLVAGGGQLLYARAERVADTARERRTGLPAAAVGVAVLAALALLASALMPVYPFDLSEARSPLGLDGVLRWYALEPIGLGLGVLGLIAAALGGVDRVAAGAALAGAGLLAAVSELSLAAETGAGAFSVQLGTWVALAAAVGLAVAGAAAALSAANGSGRERERTVAGGLDEPTRLLSAAAHLDPDFARQAVRDVLRERHRALAPAAGVALGEVLRHCLASGSRRRARNLVLAALAPALLLAIANATHGAALAGVLVLLAWSVVLTELWTARYRVAARHLSAGSDLASPEYVAPGAEAAIRDVEVSESHNLVVYSGYRPWVGSGSVQGGWTFAVNVRKGKETPGGRLEPQGFSEAELHAYVAERLLATELPTLRLADRLYVDGQHVRDDRRFLADRFARPRTTVTPAELAAADADGPPEVVRRVRSASVTAWSGEVTFSVFLDFRLEGVSLYADATYCALMPPAASYREVDRIDGWPTLVERLRVAATAAGRTAMLPLAAFAALGDAAETWRAWRRRVRQHREIARNPRFDYGATTSLRELAQASSYRRYFQWLDRDRFAKILERELLDAIVTFLDAHDIDTSDLEERQAAVLNNGVIVTGGTVSTQSLAVGAQARSSVVDNARRAAASAAGKAR